VSSFEKENTDLFGLIPAGVGGGGPLLFFEGVLVALVFEIRKLGSTIQTPKHYPRPQRSDGKTTGGPVSHPGS
jgi:hypothetical protein